MAGQMLERPVYRLEGRVEMCQRRVGESLVGNSNPIVAVAVLSIHLGDIERKETRPSIGTYRWSDWYRRNDLVRDKVQKQRSRIGIFEHPG